MAKDTKISLSETVMEHYINPFETEIQSLATSRRLEKCIELEVRLGVCGDEKSSFEAGVSKADFQSVLNILTSQFVSSAIQRQSFTDQVFGPITKGNETQFRVRTIENKNPTLASQIEICRKVHKTQQTFRVMNRKYDCRLTWAQELPITEVSPEMALLIKGGPKYATKVERISFTDPASKLRIDLSSVQVLSTPAGLLYHIELESLDPQAPTASHFLYLWHERVQNICWKGNLNPIGCNDVTLLFLTPALKSQEFPAKSQEFPAKSQEFSAKSQDEIKKKEGTDVQTTGPIFRSLQSMDLAKDSMIASVFSTILLVPLSRSPMGKKL
jgi:hypothetical protein